MISCKIGVNIARIYKKLLSKQFLVPMAFFRQYISPIIIFLIFLVALVAVSARIFLPSDLAAPAPMDENIEVSWSIIDSLG